MTPETVTQSIARLQLFLFLLMRDVLTFGHMEGILAEMGNYVDCKYNSQMYADLARSLAVRILFPRVGENWDSGKVGEKTKSGAVGNEPV